MAVVKRKRPKKAKAPRPKLSQQALKIRRLITTYQSGDENGSVLAELLEYFGGNLVEGILSLFDGEVKTLQLNYPEHVSFRVQLAYTDRSKKPTYGYHYPKLFVVKTSHSLTDAAILAYLEICKHAGEFL